jgi:O-acetyl-ADP-ribose deacetylase (regulator of RNase III)
MDVDVVRNSSWPRRERSFGRTGHRTPVATASAICCVHDDDWVKQTLQGVFLKVAALEVACNPVEHNNIDFARNKDAPSAQYTSDAALSHRLASEYAAFVAQEQYMLQFFNCPPPPLPPNVIEVIGDIFLDAPATMALGHSVAEDLEMSAGIAVDFKHKFGQVDLLLSMGRTVGQVAVLPVAQPDKTVRYVFYIITKKVSRGTRPVLSDFAAAVHNLADACTMLGVKQLALPRIGTMKDRLQWGDVRRIICEAFAGRETEVYVFRRDKKAPSQTPPPPLLADFIDPLLPSTPAGPNMQSHPDNDRTPPFVTPATLDRDATPMTPTPVGKWPCPLPDEGVPLESTTGPCATKVVSDKKEDVAHASCPEVDNTKTLTTAQGPDRSVHNSCTPATDRFLIDLEKKILPKQEKKQQHSTFNPHPYKLVQTEIKYCR